MTDEIHPTELCNRFESVYTGAITDVLDDFGYHDQTMNPEISPLTHDMNLAGIAYPCIGRPNRDVDEERNMRNILEMLGEAPENSVILYDSNADSSAQIGELSVEWLVANNSRGAVVDGGARDLSFILQTDFPLFTKFETPADAVPRWEILDWNCSAVVGGIEVEPGDFVIGDIDGVVIVPQDIVEDVLRKSEELVDIENHVRDDVSSGTPPLEAYEDHGVF